ncbi:hypothetical protein ABZ929_22355 [Streptomyces physcomitrii]|uniref:hypothetical protein n=1 Tax=Streptomyces physcomitrii TaxID=2724184 RepID=UPI00341525B8
MTDELRLILLGLAVAVLGAALGWLLRSSLWRRGLRRRQSFFGLPPSAECLLVVDREAGATEFTVTRHDVFALLELSPLIKECGAHAQVHGHDAPLQSLGERTEFCVGGPESSRRMALHLRSLLPGVRVHSDPELGPRHGEFRIGGDTYPMEQGVTEYVLLARLTAGEGPEERPAFLFCGQRAITHQAAARYLARHHQRLHRRYGRRPFVLLLKVVNSQAYGPDVVELVADVTRKARTATAKSTKDTKDSKEGKGEKSEKGDKSEKSES